MRSRTHLIKRLWLAVLGVVLLASLATPASAAEEISLLAAGGSVSSLAADDVAPGVDIADASDYPRAVVAGSLNATTDVHDYLSFYAAPGEQIFLLAEVPSGSPLNLDLELWRSTGGPPQYLRDAQADATGDWICFTVPESYAPGIYYVDVRALGGAGTYELTWSISSRSDGNFPGVPIPDSPFEDIVSSVDDAYDVFEVHVGEGESLSVDLITLDVTDQIQLHLYGPAATSVWSSGVEDLDGPGNLLSVNLPPRGPAEDGVYYVAVTAAADTAAAYTLSWATTGGNVNMPGTPLPAASPFTTTLGFDRVYYVDLEYGQRIDLDIKAVSNPMNMKLYGPTAVDTRNTPVAIGDPISYWVSAEQAGRHYLCISPSLPGTAFTLTYSITDGVEREAGNDRYVTSAMVSEADFPKGADVVVVATGADFPDALSAASLAGAYGAPILLTKPGSLPYAVKAEITRLGATRCFIVGGENAVSAEVATAIGDLPGMLTPVRLAGPDRYSTAAAVAETTFFRQGAFQLPLAFVARGDDFADALSLSPIGWASHFPILLTKPNDLPSSTASFLAENPIDVIMIAGGTAAVSDAVEDAIDTVMNVGYDPTDRLMGANRYATAAVVADWAASTPLLDWSYVGIATGTNFPDALGGGAGAASKGGVLLLTRPTELSGNTASIMNTHQAEIESVQLLGGTAALSNTVEGAVSSIVQ